MIDPREKMTIGQVIIHLEADLAETERRMSYIQVALNTLRKAQAARTAAADPRNEKEGG